MDLKKILFIPKILAVVFLTACAGYGLTSLVGLAEGTLHDLLFSFSYIIVLYTVYWVEETIRYKNAEIEDSSQ